MRIDLGTTDNPPEEFDLYVDLVRNRHVPADKFVLADLRLAWPWKTASVSHLRAHDLIEHLPDKIHTMNEAWRVLRAGGTFDILVPTTDGAGAWCDPTHVSYWNRASIDYFLDGAFERDRFERHYGIRARFRIEREEMRESWVDHPSGRTKVVHLGILLVAVK